MGPQRARPKPDDPAQPGRGLGTGGCSAPWGAAILASRPIWGLLCSGMCRSPSGGRCGATSRCPHEVALLTHKSPQGTGALGAYESVRPGLLTGLVTAGRVRCWRHLLAFCVHAWQYDLLRARPGGSMQRVQVRHRWPPLRRWRAATRRAPTPTLSTPVRPKLPRTKRVFAPRQQQRTRRWQGSRLLEQRLRPKRKRRQKRC